MDWPEHHSSFAGVRRLFPAPIQPIGFEVLAGHPPDDLLALLIQGMSRPDHLSIAELPHEVQIGALSTQVCCHLWSCGDVHGHTHAPKRHGVASVELFLDNAIIEQLPDGVSAALDIIGLRARPGQVPLPNPEVELIEFGS